MAQTKRKSPGGLLSEAGKKAARGIGDAAKRVVGKKKTRGKSPGGNLSEAAKKAGRGVMEAGRRVVGSRGKSSRGR
jgi:hypothetical protein